MEALISAEEAPGRSISYSSPRVRSVAHPLRVPAPEASGVPLEASDNCVASVNPQQTAQ